MQDKGKRGCVLLIAAVILAYAVQVIVVSHGWVIRSREYADPTRTYMVEVRIRKGSGFPTEYIPGLGALLFFASGMCRLEIQGASTHSSM